MPVFHQNTPFPLLRVDSPADWDLLPGLCRNYISTRDFGRIRSYLDGSVRSIIVEAAYIDKDYRDTYANFYAKKFAQYPSRTVRLHFFGEPIPEDKIWSLVDYQRSYVGFIVIRPTRVNTIGRTILDPRKVQGRKGAMCLADYKVNVLGAELSVRGFPFITQDTDVTVCAHAACWMAFRYFSEKYSRYAEIWPYEITQLTANQSFGRLIPSRGVTVGQVSDFFAGFGLTPEIYFRDAVLAAFPTDTDLFARLLYHYVESGLPVVACIPEHAFTVFGHLSDYGKSLPAGPLTDSYGYLEGLVVNDDNHLPYQTVPRTGSGAPPHPDGHTLDKVLAFVVPLYEKIHFLAENAEEAVRSILNNPVIGLAAASSTLPPDQTIVRHFLTSSRSYKRVGMGRLPVPLARLYAYLEMPKFLWVAELSTRDLYKQGKVLGEIIWDATANKHDQFGFIAVHYPELLIVNDRHSLSEKADRFTVRPLSGLGPYDVYRHNLVEVP